MINENQELEELRTRIEELEKEKKRLKSTIEELWKKYLEQEKELVTLRNFRSDNIGKLEKLKRLEIENAEQKIELNSQELNLESNAYWIKDRNEKLDAAEKEQLREKIRADIAESRLVRKEQAINQLRNAINELEKEKKSQQIANYLGFTSAYSGFRNSLIISIITFIFLIILVQIWKIISKGKKKVVKNS